MNKLPLRQLSERHGFAFDCGVMALYLAVVYGGYLRVGPLGRDYALLSGHASVTHLGFTLPISRIADVLGTSVVAYHLINLALLFGCVVLCYRLTHLVVGGRRWFGRLTAVLFMANPVHSEAVMNLCGFVDLIPAFLALLALWGHVRASSKPDSTLGAFLWPCVLAVGLGAKGLGILLVFALYELIVKERGQGRVVRLVPFLIASVVLTALREPAIYRLAALHPSNTLTPLYFIFYPIGFLPESARRFHEMPWLGWFAGAVTVFLLYLICRKAARRSLVFSLLAMAAAGLFEGGRFVDPVHMVGGGRLLVANVLFCIGLMALFYRMMEHPKWQRTLIAFTTMLCVIFFGLQIRSNHAWSLASNDVKAYQEAALAETRKDGLQPLVCAPDFQYAGGAPLCLSESVRYNTPFSKALGITSIVPIHYQKDLEVTVREWTVDKGELRISGVQPLSITPWPYALSRRGGRLETAEAIVETLEVNDETIVLSVRPTRGTLPARLIPGYRAKGK